MKGMRLINCSCTGQAAEFQDQMYGKGRRVANESGRKDDKSAKCTVCGRVDTKAAAAKDTTKPDEKDKKAAAKPEPKAKKK